MVLLPVLLMVILTSFVMGRPRAQFVDCIRYCDGQYLECAKAVVMTGMTVLAARPATKYALRAAQNMELSKHAGII